MIDILEQLLTKKLLKSLYFEPNYESVLLYGALYLLQNMKRLHRTRLNAIPLRLYVSLSRSLPCSLSLFEQRPFSHPTRFASADATAREEAAVTHSSSVERILGSVFGSKIALSLATTHRCHAWACITGSASDRPAIKINIWFSTPRSVHVHGVRPVGWVPDAKGNRREKTHKHIHTQGAYDIAHN